MKIVKHQERDTSSGSINLILIIELIKTKKQLN